MTAMIGRPAQLWIISIPALMPRDLVELYIRKYTGLFLNDVSHAIRLWDSVNHSTKEGITQIWLMDGFENQLEESKAGLKKVGIQTRVILANGEDA